MRRLPISARSLALVGVLVPLLALFVYVALRSGPLAPVPVTVVSVEAREISPALSGIGTVEARELYRIGPTAAGRVRSVSVTVGDTVRSGQLLGEMDPIDLDERIVAQDEAIGRMKASVLAAEAQELDSAARSGYAEAQARRYRELLKGGFVPVAAAEAREQERAAAEAGLSAARANLEAARRDIARARAEKEGLSRQRQSLRLVSPVDGLVVARDADPGSTVVAGQSVVQVVDPKSLWVNARFDQSGSASLAPGLPARVVVRSDPDRALAGRIERVEPMADSVTEEALAKVTFDDTAGAAVAIGALAEVTIALPAAKAAPVVPDASVQRVGGKTGVWTVVNGKIRFAEARVGAYDLDGLVQVTQGVSPGDRVVVYSQKALTAKSRVKVVESVAGISK